MSARRAATALEFGAEPISKSWRMDEWCDCICVLT